MAFIMAYCTYLWNIICYCFYVYCIMFVLTYVIRYGIINTEVKERPHRERVLYMTKEELFKEFDNVASTKTSVILNCIRDAKKVSDARWQESNGAGELQGLYRGYTDVGSKLGICEELDEEFFKRMFFYRMMLTDELAKFLVNRKKK